jgi:glutathione S-transferase
MSDKLIFYTNPMSRAQIARWMLEEVGAPYEQVLLEYGLEMNAEAYRKINPMAKVPAIKHGDHVVTEAAAICLYLADAFPAAGLAPIVSDRAAYYRWILFAAGPLEQAVTTKSLGWQPEDIQQQGRLGFGSFERTLDVLEGFLDGRRFVCGDRFTAADVYLGSHVDWGITFKTIPSRPALERYIAPLRERDAYKRAKAIDSELIAAARQKRGS